ncbi:MAG TPA: TadE/TadG family type IV pilus assembly protein [Acidimicrobiia bacterium]|nr:TadE/TadG family type IV pilus assembly protein [Acidimicrobiia bacterium]
MDAQLRSRIDRFPLSEYSSRHGAWGTDIEQQQDPVGARSSREKRERGAVLVELALALPIFLLLLLGIIEAGLALNAQITMRQAAAEAARLASVGEDIGPACDQLTDLSNGTVSGLGISAGGGGTQVSATASGTYTGISGFVPYFNNLPLSETATARLEQPGGGGSC